MKKNKYLLVIDDETSMRKNILDLLSKKNINIIEAADGKSGLEKAVNNDVDIVILDVNLPQMDGISVLLEIKKIKPDLPVIIFTAFGTNERVIEAMKNGAFDYLEKPFELDEFLLTVERGLEYSDLLKEVKELRKTISNYSFNISSDQIVGRSSVMQEVMKLVGRAAPTDATVLIQGESGTGKELIADAIQRHSTRKEKPYIKVNCGALTETLLESEIFGHEKGAFTGAVAQKLGCFELANGGTIFLDEINNMPVSLQVRLLRLLQNQNFFRVGGEIPVSVDVRVIAATNKNIEAEVEAGNFRKDLFYRLNVIRINVPPLKERKEDIPYLTDHFLKKYSPNKHLIVSEETMNKLKMYSWPGNVRELENLIHSGIVMSRENILSIDNLPTENIKQQKSDLENLDLHENVKELEKKLILTALEKTNRNKTETAKLLNINRKLLYTKMNELGIE